MRNTIKDAVQQDIHERKEWLKSQVEVRVRWLKEARQTAILVDALPDSILQYDKCSVGADFTPYLKRLAIDYHLPIQESSDTKTKLVAEIMSMWAKVGLEWERNAKLYYEKSTDFQLTGTMPVDSSMGFEGVETIQVQINGMEKPPTCKLVAKKEIIKSEVEVVTYEAICDGGVSEMDGE